MSLEICYTFRNLTVSRTLRQFQRFVADLTNYTLGACLCCILVVQSILKFSCKFGGGRLSFKNFSKRYKPKKKKNEKNFSERKFFLLFLTGYFIYLSFLSSLFSFLSLYSSASPEKSTLSCLILKTL